MATSDAQLREHVFQLLTQLEQPAPGESARRGLRELLWADAMQAVDLGSGHAQQLAPPACREAWAYFLARNEREELLAWVERARVLPELWRRVAALRSQQASTVHADCAACIAACGVSAVEPAQRKVWLGRLGAAGARAAAEAISRVGMASATGGKVEAWCRVLVDEVCERATGAGAMQQLGQRVLRAVAIDLTPTQQHAFAQLARTRGVLGQSENPPGKVPPDVLAVLISWVAASLDGLVASKGEA